ncbi:MAG: DUF4442 domain-containing protein [Myxococcota bacterium]
MSYRAIAKLQSVLPRAALFKYGFNWSPMYRRSTGKLRYVSDDLCVVKVELPLTWRNVNYVGTMFGGSILSATDPILMVQLINILGDAYVVWDKSVEMRFRRPGRSTLSCVFEYTEDAVSPRQAAPRGQASQLSQARTGFIEPTTGSTIAGTSSRLFFPLAK